MTSGRRTLPVSRDPQVVRQRILDAAQAEFMKHGYEAASTNRIAELFGGSKATMFRHFPGKDSMLEAVVQRIAGGWERSVNLHDHATSPPAVWLEQLALRTLAWILSEEPIFIGRFGIAEGHKFPALEQVFEETAARPLLVLIAGQLKRWNRQGLLRVRDPMGDAEKFVDLAISGHVSRRLYGGPPMSARKLRADIRRCVAIFLRGCSAR